MDGNGVIAYCPHMENEIDPAKPMGEMLGQVMGAQSVATSVIYATLVSQGVLSTEAAVAAMRSTAGMFRNSPFPIVVKMAAAYEEAAATLERGEQPKVNPFTVIDGGKAD